MWRFLTAVLAALWAAAPAAAQDRPATAPIPTEAFGELPFLSQPTLSPDGTQIAARLFTNGDPRIGIWSVGGGADQQPRLISPGAFAVRWFRWAGDQRLLIGVQTVAIAMGLPLPVTRVIAVDLQIDRTLPNRTNRTVDFSLDRNRVLIWSGGADDPGMYYVFDRRARRMERFAAPYDTLSAHRFAQVRPVRYTSRDGLSIPAYLTLPPGRPERGLPLIVMPHGGPFARDSWAFNPEVQFLASRGYAVLQPNFRGSTGYGRSFVERGYGQFGTGMINDIDDGVDWLIQQGIADRSRVCIMGSSYGGYAALIAPIRSPERYRCAISMAGISDVRAMLRYDRRMLAAERYSRDWRRRVEGEERADLDAISPLRLVDRMRVPVLIAHGERDTNVLPAQSRDIVQALTRAGRSVESVFYPKAGHGFTEPEDSVDYLRRVEAFLNRHNPPDTTPSGTAR